MGNVTNRGTVVPGCVSGATDRNGNYAHASSCSYEMEVADSNSFDRLVVNRNASLAGTLEVVPLGTSSPTGRNLRASCRRDRWAESSTQS